jgi:pyruvate/2-oxoglutarate dehydrogenase complex dihydrolipoamide acyltransferase (E2) component
MSTQIKLPNLGENIESGDVLSILVSEGDTVEANQDLLEVETDKATMPIPAPQGGKITKILVREGDTVAVGADLMEMEAVDGAEKAKKKKPESPHEKKVAPAASCETQKISTCRRGTGGKTRRHGDRGRGRHQRRSNRKTGT